MSQISRLRDAEISNGNLINADDIDAELNQLVSESNGQDTRLTNLESSTMTIAGVKTFSSAPRIDQIDEHSLNTGVTVDSLLIKDGAIGLASIAGYAPANNGELGYDSTSNTYKVMENGTAKTILTLPFSVSAKSTAYTIVLNDRNTVFVCTSAFTLSLTAAATLGAGWLCYLRNDGTGLITIDPNASETIDGFATIILYPGQSCTLVCDGSNFKTIGRSGGLVFIQSQTATSVSSVDFTIGISSDFDEYIIVHNGIYPGTSAVDFWLRVSQDGGATWKSGASDYRYGNKYSNTGASWGSADASGDSKIVLARALNNAAATPIDGIVRFFRPSSTSAPKPVLSDNYNFSSAQLERAVNYGYYQGNNNAINSIRFMMSSGNLYGTFTLYGVQKS